jgi:hypothetical protein
MSDIDLATLLLCRVKERYMRDDYNRELASAKLVNQLVEKARAAGLSVESNGVVHQIKLAKAVFVRLSHAAGEVLLGNDLQRFEGLDFDPVAKEYTGPHGEPGVEVLARKVADTLDALAVQTKKRETRI